MMVGTATKGRTAVALVAALLPVVLLGEVAQSAERPRLRGVVQNRAGENIEGWIRFEKEVTRVEIIGGEEKGKVREVGAADLKMVSFHVVGMSEPGLKGNYYRDTNFGGAPTERVDPVIDFAWNTTAPMAGFPADNFSVRWEGEIETAAAGNYQFHASSDDGVRLWIDNRGVIDRWTNQAETEFSGGIDLQGGRRYPIRLEYFEGGSQAALHLRWTPPGGTKAVVPNARLWHSASAEAPGPEMTQPGLLGSYFKGNTNFGGTPVQRVDAKVDFDWTKQESVTGFGFNGYSVRWEGEVVAPVNGNVTFHTRTDDGVRLWIDGRGLIDQWRGMQVAEFQGVFPMEAGKRYPIRMEYFQDSGPSEVRLYWSGPGLGRQVIPTSGLFSGSGGVRAPRNGEGLLLTGGTFLAGAIRGADDRMVAIGIRGGAEARIPRRSIGAILFDPIDETRRADLERRRPGCVIRGKNDYLESELVASDGDQIEMSSPLFGDRAFPLDRIQYVKLNPFDMAAAANYELRTKSGSLMRAEQLVLTGEKAMVKDNSLWWIEWEPGDVAVVLGISGGGG